MKSLMISALLLVSGLAQAGTSIPANLEFPHKNAPTAGTNYRMADHANGVFVFEAYRLDCSYCNASAPLVNKLATTYAANTRVQVIDLSQDHKDTEHKLWISRQKPNHPVVEDVDGYVFNSLIELTGVPQTFVVNCKGDLVGRHRGGWDSSTDGEIRGYVEKALKTTCQ